MTKNVKNTTKVVLTSPCKWSILVLVIQVVIIFKKVDERQVIR